MAGQELTRDEVFALARAFRVDSARALLRVAGFPSWAVPETGFANAREFWTKISEELGGGAMTDGRAEILKAARDWFPANGELAALAAAAESPAAGPGTAQAGGPGTSGATITISGGQGVQLGSNNVQHNYYGVQPERETP
jgi:Effector-associated domain 1/RIP homotypic interaction motif